VASVSGKAGDVTTNFRNDGYEVTVTKSDGSQVEVHMDRSFKVMAPGGPGGPGRPGGPPPGTGYGSGSNSGASQSTEGGEAPPAV
jgi:hypothetical protein